MTYEERIRDHFRSTPEAYARMLARKPKRFKEPKQTHGLIVRLVWAAYADNTHQTVTVELPPSKSALFGPLAVHPRLTGREKGFEDDTLDGETFFCSAHHCRWANGSRFKPYTITHLASGRGFGVEFHTLAEAKAVAADLAADSIVEWDAIDADPMSARAQASLRHIAHKLREQGHLKR